MAAAANQCWLKASFGNFGVHVPLISSDLLLLLSFSLCMQSCTTRFQPPCCGWVILHCFQWSRARLWLLEPNHHKSYTYCKQFKNQRGSMAAPLSLYSLHVLKLLARFLMEVLQPEPLQAETWQVAPRQRACLYFAEDAETTTSQLNSWEHQSKQGIPYLIHFHISFPLCYTTASLKWTRKSGKCP